MRYLKTKELCFESHQVIDRQVFTRVLKSIGPLPAEQTETLPDQAPALHGRVNSSESRKKKKILKFARIKANKHFRINKREKSEKIGTVSKPT